MKFIRKSTLKGVFFIVSALLALPVWGQATMIAQDLMSIQEERAMLTEELSQYEKTLALLLPGGASPEASANPVVRNLAGETIRIRKQLIEITEREVGLLREKIASHNAMANRDMPPGSGQVEGRSLRTQTENYSLADEEEDVARLLTLLTKYYGDLQRTLDSLPSEAELTAQAIAQQDASELAKIPFSVDKVRLNSTEGTTALAQFSERLDDAGIPESRHDMSPICGIKTRLFGTLIASENRSLKPVGKNQYIARIRLQPGDTTLRIEDDTWDLRLPQSVVAKDYLITFYVPKTGKPELHVFAVDDLLAQDVPYIPAWMPAELNLTPVTG